MNFEDYYPGATIHNVEYLENIIIIHTEADPEKEVRTINDLPMFGKSVLIRVSEDASYEWIGVTSKTKRLNKLITSCCKSAPDEDSMEELVALNNVRCSPFEPCIIIDSNRDLYEKSSVPVPVSKRDNRGRTSTFNYELLIEALRKIEHDKGIYYYHMPSEYWITKRDELVFNDEGVVIDTNYTYRKLPEYLNKEILK